MTLRIVQSDERRFSEEVATAYFKQLGEAQTKPAVVRVVCSALEHAEVIHELRDPMSFASIQVQVAEKYRDRPWGQRLVFFMSQAIGRSAICRR
jgi:hypothetical protein